MNYVLDACAMIAFLRDERGADVVDRLLSDSSNRCCAHVVNLCEVYYDFIRVSNDRTARAAMRDLQRVGVRPRRNISTPFWRQVALLKGTIRRVSLADCFAIALANSLTANVVTSDHHEFDAIVAAGHCTALFIR